MSKFRIKIQPLDITVTYDEQTEEQEASGELKTVFKDGVCTKKYNWIEVKQNLANTLT